MDVADNVSLLSGSSWQSGGEGRKLASVICWGDRRGTLDNAQRVSYLGSPTSNLGAVMVVPYVLLDKATRTPKSRWVRLQGRILGRQPVKIPPNWEDRTVLDKSVKWRTWLDNFTGSCLATWEQWGYCWGKGRDRLRVVRGRGSCTKEDRCNLVLSFPDCCSALKGSRFCSCLKVGYVMLKGNKEEGWAGERVAKDATRVISILLLPTYKHWSI